MSLMLSDKKAIVADVAEMFQQATSVVAAHYGGITVSDITELRVAARKSNVLVRVVRNSLARRSIEDTSYACLSEALVGPMILFFSMEEASAAAKLVRDFMKKNEKLDCKAIVLDGQLHGPEHLAQVASLPTLDEARAILVATLQAPAGHFVRTVAQPAQELLRVVQAIGEKEAAA